MAIETILADQKEKSIALILFDTFMPIVYRCTILVYSSTLFNLQKENLQKDHSVCKFTLSCSPGSNSVVFTKYTCSFRQCPQKALFGTSK